MDENSEARSRLSLLDGFFPLHTLPKRLLYAADTYRGLLKRSTDRKVGLIIAGAMRSGTTTLAGYLRQHPEVCWGPRKELHFFDSERLFRGKPNYRLYHARFNPRPEHKLLAEGTPYLHWRPAARRMFDYNPDLKLVVILRNPIERAYSHWNLRRSRGEERLPFTEALVAEQSRPESKRAHEGRAGYIEVGRYVEQIERLGSFFPPDQILLLRTENLASQPQEALDEICEFIGVTPQRYETGVRRNVGEYESSMTADQRQLLRQIYETEIRALEKLTGWDLTDWLEPAPLSTRTPTSD
jgi:hypothetical protein